MIHKVQVSRENNSESLQCCGNKFVTGLMRWSAVLVGASIFFPVSSFASTYDGQSVHVNSGESVQVDCASGNESTAQLEQFGNTRYYSLRCVDGSNNSAQAPAPPLVESSSSGTTIHLDRGSSVPVVCYGGSANLDTAGNTKYYGLNCSQ